MLTQQRPRSHVTIPSACSLAAHRPQQRRNARSAQQGLQTQAAPLQTSVMSQVPPRARGWGWVKPRIEGFAWRQLQAKGGQVKCRELRVKGKGLGAAILAVPHAHRVLQGSFGPSELAGGVQGQPKNSGGVGGGGSPPHANTRSHVTKF